MAIFPGKLYLWIMWMTLQLRKPHADIKLQLWKLENVHTKYSVRYFYSNNAISREIYWNDKKVYRQYFPKRMHFLEFRALWNVHFVDLRNLRNWKFNQEYWMFTFIIFITFNLPKSSTKKDFPIQFVYINYSMEILKGDSISKINNVWVEVGLKTFKRLVYFEFILLSCHLFCNCHTNIFEMA